MIFKKLWHVVKLSLLSWLALWSPQQGMFGPISLWSGEMSGVCSSTSPVTLLTHPSSRTLSPMYVLHLVIWKQTIQKPSFLFFAEKNQVNNKICLSKTNQLSD